MRGDDAGADLALLQLREEVLAHLGLGLLEPGPAGQHHVVAVLVELDDLGLELLADVRLQVAHAAHLDQRRGQEAAQADVEDQAALDDLDDRCRSTTPSSSLIFSIVPQARSYWARFLDRIRRPSLSSFWRTRASISSPTLDDLVGVDVVLDGQLARGDDALGLVADVEEDLVAVDLDDGAFDDVAVVEVLDGLVDRRPGSPRRSRCR